VKEAHTILYEIAPLCYMIQYSQILCLLLGILSNRLRKHFVVGGKKDQ